MRRRRRRRLSLYVAHRWLGAAVALLVLVVAATGLVLNHAVDWGLDRRPVRLAVLQAAYGVDAPAPTHGYSVGGGHWLSSTAERSYWDTRMLAETGELLGVADSGEWILAVGRRAALLLDRGGTLVEQRTDVAGWPGPISALYSDGSSFIIDTPRGRFRADPELLAWTPHGSEALPLPVAREPLPPALGEAVRADARARLLNWERVLLDIHSGRLPGRAGIIATDLLALALIGLAVSGLWLWVRHLRRQRSRR